MKLKKLKVKTENKNESKKDIKPIKREPNKLPPDEYLPMFSPLRFLVRETVSSKDANEKIKQYIELSVKRFNDDEAMPFIWLQMYQESSKYTGYLKGKSIYLPLEMLEDLITNLDIIYSECDKRGITY